MGKLVQQARSQSRLNINLIKEENMFIFAAMLNGIHTVPTCHFD